MKQLKKLTRNDKEYLSRRKLNPEEWGLVSEDNENYIYAKKYNPSEHLVRPKYHKSR